MLLSDWSTSQCMSEWQRGDAPEILHIRLHIIGITNYSAGYLGLPHDSVVGPHYGITAIGSHHIKLVAAEWLEIKAPRWEVLHSLPRPLPRAKKGS